MPPNMLGNEAFTQQFKAMVGRGCPHCTHQCFKHLAPVQSTILAYRKSFSDLRKAAQDRDLLWISTPLCMTTNTRLSAWSTATWSTSTWSTPAELLHRPQAQPQHPLKPTEKGPKSMQSLHQNQTLHTHPHPAMGSPIWSLRVLHQARI